MTRKLILASGSPRRREFISFLGLDFTVVKPAVKEDQLPGESPDALVARLSVMKSAAVSDQYPEAVVLAADTVVSIDGQILGKPHDRNDALRMIKQLSGRTHQVYTAVTLRHKEKIKTLCTCTHVTFADISDDLAVMYVNSGEGDDKAGSYALQGRAAMFIETVEGSVSSVIGLPLSETRELLCTFGIIPNF
ncbi:MAG: septum formation inhibitor Maf [Succinivibrio sp.]|nr:septum formation inhibitor Maf [Succinivibrio sp.]